MGRLFQVLVTGFKGERMTIDLCNTEEQMKTMTVEQLRQKIAAKLPPNTDMDKIRLIFLDEHLDDDSRLLSDYGIRHLSVIQITIRVDGGGGGPMEREDEKESGNMGDRDGRNVSMNRLSDFNSCSLL